MKLTLLAIFIYLFKDCTYLLDRERTQAGGAAEAEGEAGSSLEQAAQWGSIPGPQIMIRAAGKHY